MANEKRLIYAEPIIKFIVDGLNNPNLKEAFGHDAIEILAEIEYAPTVDAVEVVHGQWINTLPYRALNGNYNKAQECSVCHAFFVSSGNTPYSNHPYCCECGAKMDDDQIIL